MIYSPKAYTLFLSGGDMKRDDLVAYLDGYLQVAAIEDRSNNGLQVEGVQDVHRVAFAVDASLAAFEAAAGAGAQMLIVHHGLFWGEPILVTGPHRRRLGQLFDAGMSLYAAHLPLDVHGEVGNNVTLARWLGLESVAPFGELHGQFTGVLGSLPRALLLADFAALVEEALGEPVIRVWPFGPETVERVGICSGAASSLLDRVAVEGVDVYLTGEMKHSAFHQAEELGLNVVYGGHYATETAGLKALAEHLADRYEVETVFLDLPTGA
jgi:dinuclear metal center YbgI/SA1388 family protein